MDRHDFSSVTAKELAVTLERYGCRGLTYWFDEERQMSFCLIEAPNKQAIETMHEQAHSLIPYEILEVENHIINFFLGRIEQTQFADASATADELVLDDSAFRIILATELKDAALLPSKIGGSEAQEILQLLNDIIQRCMSKYNGKEVQHVGRGLLASFIAATEAVLCAIEIQNDFRLHKRKTSADPLCIEIGLSANTSANGNSDFFGQTIQLAKRLCKVPGAHQLAISSMVRDLLKPQRPDNLGKSHIIRILNLPEEQFLNQLFDCTETTWNESRFTIFDLAKALGLSRSQLYRKTTALMGYSPNEFVKEFRLTKAVEFIESQEGTIADVAYQTGFTSPSYFSKCFLKRFSILPSSYANAVAASNSL
jgi:AraC-like DNA-binding protein